MAAFFSLKIKLRKFKPGVCLLKWGFGEVRVQVSNELAPLLLSSSLPLESFLVVLQLILMNAQGYVHLGEFTE